MSSARPQSTEYHDFYRGYIELVPDGPILGTLRSGMDKTLELWRGVGAERADHRYQPGKWSVKEVAGHVVDVERVFSYRALMFARGDRSPLPGMEQDELVEAARFGERRLDSIAEELRHLRQANLELFGSFDDETLMRRGTASGCEFTVRAVLYAMAGHERHHRIVLREKYL